MLHFRQSSVNTARGPRRTARVALAAALLWTVQAHAALRVDDGSAPRGNNDVSSQPSRLVTGDPAQIDAVVAGGPGATAILAITPVAAKVGSYPPGTTIVGNELRAPIGGFRAWFEVQLSNWDPNGDNVPPLKVYQVKLDCSGYTSGKGAPLADPVIPCTNDAPGNNLCRGLFGEVWATCFGGFCRGGYLDSSGTQRPADNWCAPDGCESPDIAINIRSCFYGTGIFFAVYNGPVRTDGHIVYYGGTHVVDIPPGAKGKYCVELFHDETFLADTSAPPNDIPTAQENGFCVNIVTGQCCFGLGTSDQGCVDDVLRSECDDEPGPVVFTPDHRCPPIGPDCAHIGACCDTLNAQCEDRVEEGACQGTHRAWTRNAFCDQVECTADTGACCDRDPFAASCADNVVLSDCQCATCTWRKLAACAEIECTQISIPTTSEWGLAILTLLLLTGAKIYFGRSKVA